MQSVDSIPSTKSILETNRKTNFKIIEFQFHQVAARCEVILKMDFDLDISGYIEFSFMKLL